MRTTPYSNLRAKLALLLIAAAILLALSFIPNTRSTLASSEMRYSETSAHGLSIVPASCASGAQYYHFVLPTITTGGGYYLPSGADGYGAYSSAGGYYVCFSSNSANVYFIPANTAAEIASFRAHPPPGVTVY